MEHVVFFPAQDGSPAFRRVGSLEEAVRLVEHLRNVEGVNEVSCHALTEVPLAFRAYYRVEVPGASGGPVAGGPVGEAGPAEAAPALVTESALQPAAEAAVPPAAQLAPDPGMEPRMPELPAQVGGDSVVAPGATELVPEPAMTTVNGHSGESARSLGFFA